MLERNALQNFIQIHQYLFEKKISQESVTYTHTHPNISPSLATHAFENNNFKFNKVTILNKVLNYERKLLEFSYNIYSKEKKSNSFWKVRSTSLTVLFKSV